MDETQSSPQRAAAIVHLTHARTHLAKGKTDRALEEALLAVETDSTFEEARYFIAETYERLGEPRKALHQYEELLYKHHDDEDLVQRIERIDPATAAKHRRLAAVAPDPFVSGGQAVPGPAGDFDDMEETDALPAPVARVELTVAPEGPTELADIEEDAPSEAAAATPQPQLDTAAVFEDDGYVAASAPAAVQPQRYEYEDERHFRETAGALPAVHELLRKQRGLWGDLGPFDDLIRQSRPLTYTENEEAANAFYYAASILGAGSTVPCLVTEPSLWPLLCGPLSAYVVIPTGALDALNPTELYFLAGRTLARTVCDHVALLDVIAAVLPASRPGSRLQELQRQAAMRIFGGTDALGEEALRKKAQNHLHTWRLRAELTADRAGLVCCQSLPDAASAVAKLTAPDATAAGAMSAEVLEHRFAGQDLSRIAAIGLDRDPTTSEPYAFYRLRMLKWWSTQPGYTQLQT